MVPGPNTRRQVIAAGILTALPLVSGCAAFSSSETESRLGHVTVENGDDAPHTIHVVVGQDSTLVYGSTHELEAISAPKGADDFGSVDSAVIEPDNWEGTGNWAVYSRVDGQTTWEEHELPGDDAADCHAVRLKIEDDSSVTGFTPDCGSWPPGNAT